MPYQPKVYTIGHILGMTGMMAAATTYMYVTRHKDETLTWFVEHWGLNIGIGMSVLTFLYGLSLLGTPWYDDKTNEQLKAEHDRAEFEWRCKSPEERAIITAATEIELLQLTQIMQNSSIIQNQEQLRRKLSGK